MPPKPKFSKEMILKAALKLIEEQGYSSLSVHKIAEEMKCSTQPIYSNFKSFQKLKEQIALEIYNDSKDFIEKDYGYSTICNFAIGYTLTTRNNPSMFRALSGTEIKLSEYPEAAANMYLDVWEKMKKEAEIEGVDLDKLSKLFFHVLVYIQGFSHEIVRGVMDVLSEEEIIVAVRSAVELLTKILE